MGASVSICCCWAAPGSLRASVLPVEVVEAEGGRGKELPPRVTDALPLLPPSSGLPPTSPLSQLPSATQHQLQAPAAPAAPPTLAATARRRGSGRLLARVRG